MNRPLALEVALMSDRGGRDYNEDACGHWRSANQLCCVLADGAGGHGGGDIASKLIVKELIGLFAQTPSHDGPTLAELLRQTNERMRLQKAPGTIRQDMHSTAVSLVIDFNRASAHWAHVGDSRLYWFRHGVLQQRTKDHSLVQSLLDAGMLTREQMQGHPQRSELRTAMGLPDESLEVDSGTGLIDIEAGDVFLLCSDGLWEYLEDRLLESSLTSASTPAAWLDRLALEVRRLAGHKASHDNFSALTVWVGGEPSAQESRHAYA